MAPRDHALGRVGWRRAWAESLSGRLVPAQHARNYPERLLTGLPGGGGDGGMGGVEKCKGHPVRGQPGVAGAEKA